MNSSPARAVCGTLRRLGAAIIVASLTVTVGHGDALRQSASQRIIENDRVIISSIAAAAGDRRVPRDARLPAILVTLADGAVRLVNGSDAIGSAPAVLIELKDIRATPSEPPSGVARAFPREGAMRVFENERVVVWDVTWTPGMRTPVHFHDKDVVAVYLGAGTVRSIPLDGEPTATPRSFGEAVFLPRGRTHVEECVEGPRRDVIIELK